MLQQAIALSLFPEHDVQVRAEIPAQSEAETFDVLIIDVSAHPELAPAIAGWGVPLILIGLNAADDVFKRDHIVCIDKPLAKQSLEAAVARCLAGESKHNGQQAQSATRKDPDKPSDAVIDLTEVVEDESAGETSEVKK